MIDANDHIRKRLRQARDEAGLSQRQFADLISSSKGTVSDLERGRIRINAGDLVRFAGILDKPVQFFYPDPQGSDLSQDEQLLVRLFRRLGDTWQQNVMTQVKSQVALYEATTGEDAAVKEIESLPEDQREDAAYRTAYRWMEPFFRVGFRIYVDSEGNATFGFERFPRLRLPFLFQDEKDKKIMLEVQRHFHLDQSDD